MELSLNQVDFDKLEGQSIDQSLNEINEFFRNRPSYYRPASLNPHHWARIDIEDLKLKHITPIGITPKPVKINLKEGFPIYRVDQYGDLEIIYPEKGDCIYYAKETFALYVRMNQSYDLTMDDPEQDTILEDPILTTISELKKMEIQGVNKINYSIPDEAYVIV